MSLPFASVECWVLCLVFAPPISYEVYSPRCSPRCVLLCVLLCLVSGEFPNQLHQWMRPPARQLHKEPKDDLILHQSTRDAQALANTSIISRQSRPAHTPCLSCMLITYTVTAVIAATEGWCDVMHKATRNGNGGLCEAWCSFCKYEPVETK